MRVILGFLCLVLTCGIGMSSVLFVGTVVYYDALNRAIAADQLVSNPLVGSENYGASFAFLLNSLLYSFSGFVVGLLATVQIARMTHLWSSNTWRIGLPVMITELATCVGVGLLLGLLTGINAYPHLRNPNAPTPSYALGQSFLMLLGIALVGTNFWLPRLIRMLSFDQ